MTKQVKDDDLKRIAGGAGFDHISPDPGDDPGSGVDPVISTVPGAGGHGPGPEADGGSSGSKNLTK
jgi:hypothetical protein